MRHILFPKIKLFFSGWDAKYQQNKDYFVSVDFQLLSGKNQYEGRISLEDNRFCFSFSGKAMYPTLADALSRLAEEILKYDTAIVYFRERGYTTCLRIDEKTIKMEKREEQNILSTQDFASGYKIDLNRAANLMRTLGFLTDDGKLKNDMIRKYHQTNRILELTADLFRGKNDLTVVDCACGKSYLSFVMNYFLWEELHIRAKFVGVDYSETVIRDSEEIAKQLGYSNMEFLQADLRGYESTFHPDVVMSLHACDTATDMALGYALRHQAETIICVPCCHKELLEQYELPDFASITKYGHFRTKLNDIITDGLRALKLEAEGYEVSCREFCSPLNTPKNLLICGQRMSHKNKTAQAEYERLLRLWNVRPSIEYYSASLNE